MTLDQLEVIDAIAAHGSFRGAAAALNRSQPALSSAVKKLEEELGVRLFDRSAYRPTMTHAGTSFLTAAREALEAVQQTQRVGLELSKNATEARLNLAVDALAPLGALSIVARECTRPTVPTTLVIHPTVLKGHYESLLRGEIDLALAPCPHDNARIAYVAFHSIILVGAIARPLISGRRLTIDSLRKQTQIVVYDKSADESPDPLLPGAVMEGSGPKIFVPHHAMKLRLIKAGLGWGRISKEELNANKELALIDNRLSQHVPLEICLLRAKKRPLGPVARAIWNEFERRELR